MGAHLVSPQTLNLTYHGAREVVLRQTEIHHTLSTVELWLHRGQLRQDLWSERRGGAQDQG